jgi:hypothetical protein
MQTPQRKIPVRGANGKFITWEEMLPIYEGEVLNFRRHLDSLAQSPSAPAVPAPAAFQPAAVELKNVYRLDSGARPFSDSGLTIRAVAVPLKGLQGQSQSAVRQRSSGTRIEFTCSEPVDLLIGFFDQKGSGYLPPPQLETDASANDYGQAEPKIIHAMVIDHMPSVNVHAWSFRLGAHTLELGKGVCLVLGFVKPLGNGKSFDAGLNEPGKKDLDWLFE